MRVWPTPENGGSTGLAPIQVKSPTVEMNAQNEIFFAGENFLFIVFLFRVSTRSTRIAAAIATTPPSLDGIDRRIA